MSDYTEATEFMEMQAARYDQWFENSKRLEAENAALRLHRELLVFKLKQKARDMICYWQNGFEIQRQQTTIAILERDQLQQRLDALGDTCDAAMQDAAVLTVKCDQLQKELAAAEQARHDFMDNPILRYGLDPSDLPCEKCGGMRVRPYGDSTTYDVRRGKGGGQAITSDICDECWGTGQQGRRGRNVRELLSERDELRQKLKDARDELTEYQIEHDIAIYEVGEFDPALHLNTDRGIAVVMRRVLQRLTQLRQELAETERKAIEQSEYIQSHGLTEFEMNRLKAERDAATQAERERCAKIAEGYKDSLDAMGMIAAAIREE